MLRLSAFMVEESSWCPSVQCAGVIPSRAGTLVELSTFRMLAENTAMAGKWSSISAIYRSTMETQIKIDMIQIYIVNRSTQKVETMFTCHECEKRHTKKACKAKTNASKPKPKKTEIWSRTWLIRRAKTTTKSWLFMLSILSNKVRSYQKLKYPWCWSTE